MRLVLIITDIGGPPALHDLLSQLPREYELPIVVLQSFDVGVIETSAAVLKRTVPLEISMLEDHTTLRPGNVYFAQPERSYRVIDCESGFLVGLDSGPDRRGALANTVQSFADVCGDHLTVLFLSGKGKGLELLTVCDMLERAGSHIVVLHHLEAVVSDMGRQIIQHAGKAEELKVSEIAVFLQRQGVAGKQSNRADLNLSQ